MMHSSIPSLRKSLRYSKHILSPIIYLCSSLIQMMYILQMMTIVTIIYNKYLF